MKLRREVEECSIHYFALDDDGIELSHGGAYYQKSRLNGALVNTQLVGGIGTDPEYRRRGSVRFILEGMFEDAKERNCLVSLLHPFSFAYYRKFGFERVSDHRILEFPMSALSCFERCCNLKKVKDKAQNAILSDIYNEFSENRNIMFPRKEDTNHGDGHKYIWYDENGKPAAFIALKGTNPFIVNHATGGDLDVYTMCFTTKESLLALFGFIRMYEGEFAKVKIHNTAMAPEIEKLLRHYTHTSITVVPDIMARVNDVGGVLSVVNYPRRKGHFIVKVTEPERTSHSPELTDGVWEVTYENGKGDVKRLANDYADYDIKCDIPAFTQMIYGYESFGADIAKYVDSVELKNSADDFFAAFPNRPVGAFEHF